MARKIDSKSMTKLIDYMGGIDKIREGFERHRKDSQYFDTHREELLREHKEEWVAVYKEEVIGHSKHFMDLLSLVDKETRKDSVIRHVTTKRRRFILGQIPSYC